MFIIGAPAIISLSIRISVPFPLNITCIGFIGMLNCTSPIVHKVFKYLLDNPFDFHSQFDLDLIN